MSWLITLGAIIVWPFITFITQYVKTKRWLSWKRAISVISVLVAIIYVVIQNTLDPEQISRAIELVWLTSATSMIIYNFMKSFISDK